MNIDIAGGLVHIAAEAKTARVVRDREIAEGLVGGIASVRGGGGAVGG